mmetsp:Transcript_19431/g.29980  ORF Transcript_19431/g.29980 Transcript_19431/m.29980 type:complete len:83 (-) Transcript_19431:162-410(-)
MPYYKLYQCEQCNFGTKHGATEESLVDHIRGCHCMDVHLGNAHYAHCNDCPRSNGHGRRFASFQHLLEHLSDVHGYECSEFP